MPTAKSIPYAAVFAVLLLGGSLPPRAAQAEQLSVWIQSDRNCSYRCTLSQGSNVVSQQIVDLRTSEHGFSRKAIWNVPAGCNYWASVTPVQDGPAPTRVTAKGCTTEGLARAAGRTLGTLVFRLASGTAGQTPIGSLGSAAPLGTMLQAPAPNPSTGFSLWSFTVASAGGYKLEVYDVAGRRVRTLSDGSLEVGSHSVSWDGLDEAGHAVASGIYLCRMSGKGVTQERQIVIAR